MSDLGAINSVLDNAGIALALPAVGGATVPQATFAVYKRTVPDYLGGEKPLARVLGGVISGVVTVQGAPAANIRVELHYRKTGALLDVVYSAVDGSYSFANLDKTSAEYTVLAITEQPYNAVIFDKLTPV